jgi:hypothetical protein
VHRGPVGIDPHDGLHQIGRASATSHAKAAGIAFRWKDCRADGAARWKTMRLHPQEFIRRFLPHVLQLCSYSGK